MRFDLRTRLRGILPDDKFRLVPRSFDIIGSKQKAVAVIEIQNELRHFENEIARALMNVHKNVRSVLAKESEREGEFRTRELRLVEGDLDTEVIHKESGCVFKLDPRRVYFSPRESAERERICAKVGEGENVLVMFSGVGPFPICIAKKHRNVKVTAVELNPDAHNYCVENIHLNRVEDKVVALQGDVKEMCLELESSFERILMPLPKGAYKFLNIAIPLLRNSGVLHFYHWSQEPELFGQAEKLIQEEAWKCGRTTDVIERARVSQYSPRFWKVRVDAQFSH